MWKNLSLDDAIHHDGLQPINLGSKKHEFNWVGKKIEHDITWCYLEIEDINMFYKGIITNLIFVADYQDQLNITHFIKGNKWKCSCTIKVKFQT